MYVIKRDIRIASEQRVKRRSIDELQAELNHLMQEQITSLGNQTFVRPDHEQLKQQEERLNRVREVSADYLAALKELSQPKLEGEHMSEKPSVTLPGKVEKI